jgi:phospholipid/cholesterol/gamma-HCH transport system substrate-binding protein
VERLAVKAGRAVALLDVAANSDLRQDAIATIRAKSLLGEKVVDINAGSATAPPLAAGATLARTRSAIEADQVFSRLAPVLDKVDPRDLARLIRASSRAFERMDVGSLQRLVDRLDRLAEAGAPKLLAVLDKMDGLAPKAERLIASLDALATQTPAFLDRTDTLVRRTQGLVDSVAGDLATPSVRVVRRMDALLERLPSSLDRLDKLSDRLNVTLDQADPAFDRLSTVLSDAQLRRILRQEGIRIHIGP